MLEALQILPDALARDVVAHLCSADCRNIGETVELCESRGDCYIVVTCGGCGTTFTLDDDQYDALVAWTAEQGESLSCGIMPLAS